MAKHLRMGQRRRNKHWVNVYWPDKDYGGSEEGGWWYNYAHCVESYPCRSEKQAEKLRASLLAQRKYQGHPHRTLSSINHRLGDTVDIFIENREGADWSDYRPWE